MLPNLEIPQYDGTADSVYLYDLLEEHLLLFFISSTCRPCQEAAEAIASFLDRTPDCRAAVFIHTDTKLFPEFKEAFEPYAQVFRLEDSLWLDQLGIIGFPWGISLNRAGQIIASNPSTQYEWIVRLYEPFLRARALNP